MEIPTSNAFPWSQSGAKWISAIRSFVLGSVGTPNTRSVASLGPRATGRFGLVSVSRGRVLHERVKDLAPGLPSAGPFVANSLPVTHLPNGSGNERATFWDLDTK